MKLSISVPVVRHCLSSSRSKRDPSSDTDSSILPLQNAFKSMRVSAGDTRGVIAANRVSRTMGHSRLSAWAVLQFIEQEDMLKAESSQTIVAL